MNEAPVINFVDITLPLAEEMFGKIGDDFEISGKQVAELANKIYPEKSGESWKTFKEKYIETSFDDLRSLSRAFGEVTRLENPKDIHVIVLLARLQIALLFGDVEEIRQFDEKAKAPNMGILGKDMKPFIQYHLKQRAIPCIPWYEIVSCKNYKRATDPLTFELGVEKSAANLKILCKKILCIPPLTISANKIEAAIAGGNNCPHLKDVLSQNGNGKLEINPDKFDEIEKELRELLEKYFNIFNF